MYLYFNRNNNSLRIHFISYHNNTELYTTTSLECDRYRSFSNMRIFEMNRKSRIKLHFSARGVFIPENFNDSKSGVSNNTSSLCH